jgi:hypothetical protein
LVSWTRAYKAAASFVVYSIGFSIFGGFILYLGFTTVSFISFGGSSPYQVGFGIVEIIFGSIVILLGNLASFFKVNTEIIADEIGERYHSEEPDRETPTITA